jgi:hypothetical protein
MTRWLLVPTASLSLLALAPAGPLCAEDAKPGDLVAWTRDLPKAYEQAKKEGKPMMIAINSETVDGGRVERAGKELREHTYRDVRVVTKSREFVCVFLTPDGSSDDYGELRLRYGIEGLIVSPQHIFAHADGSLIGDRYEYWPHGSGEKSVKALLDMMTKALDQDRASKNLPPVQVPPSIPDAPAPPKPADPAAPPAQDPGAPPGAQERAQWIADLLAMVRGQDDAIRRAAIEKLVAGDQDHDCLRALIALLPPLAEAKNLAAQVDVVRALGRPGLMEAAPALHELLGHKDLVLRANVAVSLEYVGCRDSIEPLTKQAKVEEIESIANHLYRALGRCAAGDAKVRVLLDKKIGGSKSEFASLGPIIGMAYFTKDEKAARAIEDHLQKMGPPGGGRGRGWNGTLRRALLAWCLAEIADPKSGDFMRKKMLPQLENQNAFWTPAVITYYDAVADVCEGKADAMDAVETGILRTIEFVGGSSLSDDARKGRADVGFTPKAEWSAGGGQGGQGGNPRNP